jgi:peptidoglycan/LPS O-acetylase OafA/YrhL
MNWLNLFVHATFLFGLLPNYAFSNLSPDWSIGLEMQFYAVFPLLYLSLRRYSWWTVTIVVIVLRIATNLLFPGLFPEPSFLLLKLPLFMIGILSAEAFCRPKADTADRAVLSIVAMLLASRHEPYVIVVVALTLYMGWQGCAPNDGQTPKSHLLSILLGNRIAVFAADTSYCVYLTHGIFISQFGPMILRHDFSERAKVGLLILSVTAASYVSAWIIHHLQERPGIELGKLIIQRLFPLPSRSRRIAGVLASA